MTTPEQIDRWLQSPTETQNLEFKEAKQQYDNTKLYRYCVALANEGGGTLLMGVTDKKPRKIVGSAAFNNPVEMEAKLFKAVGFRVDMEEVGHPDGRVLVFHIPPRPLGTAYQYQGAYLMRSGGELTSMSEDQLRKIFAEGKPIWLDQIATSDLTAQDVVQLLDTQSFFELLGLPYPTNQKGVIERLLAENLILEQTDGYAIRNIGAILLAKNVRDFDTVYRKAARVVTYKAHSKLDTAADVTGEKGYAVGFRGLVRYVMSQLPQNEVIEDALRRETKLLPEVVIRELVANCLIHQDFDETGTSPLVEIYPDRVEISNPGVPIVPPERFIDGYQSRNERLADLMRRFGVCEEKSSGIDRVVESAELHQLPAPRFRHGTAADGGCHLRPKTLPGNGPERSNSRLLPALRAPVGIEANDDKPNAEAAFRTAGRQQQCRLTDHCLGNRAVPHQARSLRSQFKEIRPLPAKLGLMLLILISS